MKRFSTFNRRLWSRAAVIYTDIHHLMVIRHLQHVYINGIQRGPASDFRYITVYQSTCRECRETMMEIEYITQNMLFDNNNDFSYRLYCLFGVYLSCMFAVNIIQQQGLASLYQKHQWQFFITTCMQEYLRLSNIRPQHLDNYRLISFNYRGWRSIAPIIDDLKSI